MVPGGIARCLHGILCLKPRPFTHRPETPVLGRRGTAKGEKKGGKKKRNRYAAVGPHQKGPLDKQEKKKIVGGAGKQTQKQGNKKRPQKIVWGAARTSPPLPGFRGLKPGPYRHPRPPPDPPGGQQANKAVKGEGPCFNGGRKKKQNPNVLVSSSHSSAVERRSG